MEQLNLAAAGDNAGGPVLRQWVVTLDTGRFGDWVIVEAPDEAGARKQLTRAQLRKASSVRATFDPRIDPPARLGKR